MLKNIKFSVQISNDGKPVFELENFEYSFAKGLTAITGPNGAGKSMVPEMVLYALFGSKQLRGKSDDYKRLDVTLEAMVKGSDIIVERVKGNATLTVNGLPTASGTVAVNKAITDLFGYSPDVFNVANVAKQGEIEKLGDMKPADRKRLVDEVVGVNVLDALEVYLTGEHKAARSVAEALGDLSPLPVEPVLDSLYTKDTVDGVLASLRVTASEKARLTSIANRALAPKPVEPVRPSVTESLEALQTAEQERNRISGQLTEIESQRSALGVNGNRPEAPVAPAFIDQEADITANMLKRSEVAGELRAKQNQLTALENSRPTSIADLVEESIPLRKAACATYAQYLANLELREALRETSVPHDCPKCSHHWEDADPRLAELEAMPEVEHPGYTIAQLENHERALVVDRNATAIRAEIEALTAELSAIGNPAEKLDSINDYRRRVDSYSKYAKYDELTAKIATITVPESVQPNIAELNTYNLAHASWLMQSTDWEKSRAEIEAAKAELATARYTADIESQIADFTLERDKHIRHETELKNFTIEVERITKANERIQINANNIDQWKRCREAVRLLRAKVKGFLLPSLNKSASHLLGEMTNSQFTAIQVSEEFEITVDGQRMETLSGGGKAVANLALRLALGQVLTNRVFSVVMLDEIDASCDDARAASMAAAVRTLSDRDIIQQIILISHKQGIDADHYIRMEEMGGAK